MAIYDFEHFQNLPKPKKESESLRDRDVELLRRRKQYAEQMKPIESQTTMVSEDVQRAAWNAEKISMEKKPGTETQEKEEQLRLQKTINSINFQIKDVVDFASGGADRIPARLLNEVRKKILDIIKTETTKENILQGRELFELKKKLEAPKAGKGILRFILDQEI